MTKKLKLIFFSTAVLIAAVAGAIIFFGLKIVQTPMSSDQTEIVFEVSPKTPLASIAQELQAKGLIRNAQIFQFYARIKKLGTKIKVGEYSLNRAMNADSILATLASGKSITRSLTVAEGLNVYDIADILEKTGLGSKEEFFKLIHDKEFIKSLLGDELESLEGYLFPETYMITKYDNLKSVIAQMVKRFLAVWPQIEPLAKQMNWTRNQVVTFASIVEKETGASFERPLVSSVFHNRLVKKMRLQTDPTVLYGMAVEKGKMPNNISRNDLLTPTPYNSYTNFGLPPTPISNPGQEALMAAVKPATSNYLYFVSQNNGTHIFSETLQQHNAAVQKTQIDPSARKGKSWRDLNNAKNNDNNN